MTIVPVPIRSTAALSVAANVPGATATLDGQPLGTLPFLGEAEAGVHQLVVSAEGYDPAQLVITLEAGQPFSREVGLAPRAEAATADEPWYEEWWVWTIVGTLVAGAVVGITVGTMVGGDSGDTMPGCATSLNCWNQNLP